MENILYTFYIFNKFGECIYSVEWYRESPAVEGEKKLIVGLIYAMNKQITQQLSPLGAGASFHALSTSFYKLHSLETQTGYRFALLTAVNFSAGQGQDLLRDIFAHVFVETVSKDAHYRHEEGHTIQHTNFSKSLHQFLVEKKLLPSANLV